MEVGPWVEQVDRELRAAGTPERASHEKAYLKSELEHYGVGLPAVRKVVRQAIRRAPMDGRDDLVVRADQLWAESVHERRLAAAELLAADVGVLGPADVTLVERLIREARTWALVDVLAPRVIGPLVITYPELGDVLDRWASDDDFWIRRAAVLALLLPLRDGGGDFDRFSRYADMMKDDTEFFVRKAIGWVLRETGKKRPALVYEWVKPRAARLPGVTLREAIKPLTDAQRAAIESVRA